MTQNCTMTIKTVCDKCLYKFGGTVMVKARSTPVRYMTGCINSLFENLIQLVNIIGSIFYGNILGIFLLAFFIGFVRSNAVFIAALITQLVICVVYGLIHFEMINLPFLWLNVLGCGLVMLLAIVFEKLFKTIKL